MTNKKALPKKKRAKKSDAERRDYRIDARLNFKEKEMLIIKCNMFFDGNEADFIRDAILNYKPIKIE